MDIRFQCKACGRRLQVPDKHAGKKAKCPGCGGPIVVPQGLELRPDDAGSRAASAPAGATCPKCRTPMEADAVLCTRCGCNVKTGAVVRGPLAEDGTRKAEGSGSMRLAVFIVVAVALALGVYLGYRVFFKEPGSAQQEEASPVVAAAKGPDRSDDVSPAENLEPLDSDRPQEPDKSLEPTAVPARRPMTLTRLRALTPLCGKPAMIWTEDRKLDNEAVENLKKRTSGLADYVEGPEDEKLLPAIKAAVDDGSIESGKLMLHVCQRLGALFDDAGRVRPDMYNRFVARLKSLGKGDLRQWQPAFRRTYGEEEIPLVDVAITLLPVDELYQGDVYIGSRARKYLNRANALSKHDIDLWVVKVPAFARARLDAVMTIVLIDDFFPQERFSRTLMQDTLAGKTPVTGAPVAKTRVTETQVSARPKSVPTKLAPLPPLAARKDLPQEALAFLTDLKAGNEYEFFKNHYQTAPVLSFFVSGGLSSKRNAPQSLKTWSKAQQAALRDYVKVAIANDLATAKAKGDLRRQFIAVSALLYAEKDSEQRIDPKNVDPQKLKSMAKSVMPHVGTLKRLIAEARSVRKSANDVWDVKIDKAELISTYSESHGSKRWSVSANTGRMLLHVEGTVTNRSAEPDLPYAIWAHHPGQASATCIDTGIFKNGAIPRDARLLTHDNFLALSPGAHYMCGVVGKDSGFLGVFDIFRALGRGGNPTASSGKYLKQNESCKFDICFSVPKGERTFTLLVWGSAPVRVSL